MQFIYVVYMVVSVSINMFVFLCVFICPNMFLYVLNMFLHVSTSLQLVCFIYSYRCMCFYVGTDIDREVLVKGLLFYWVFS
jgi:hypothetical protein